MTATIKDLIQNALSDKATELQDGFKEVMSERVGTALNTFKQEIAASYFGQKTEVSEETVDEAMLGGKKYKGKENPNNWNTKKGVNSLKRSSKDHHSKGISAEKKADTNHLAANRLGLFGKDFEGKKKDLRRAEAHRDAAAAAEKKLDGHMRAKKAADRIRDLKPPKKI